MKKRILTVILAGAAVLSIGAVAIAAARSVSTKPAPAVIPHTSQITDDPATHDVGDDNGTDDPATHDVGDDNGGDSGEDEGEDDEADDGPSHT